MKTSTAPLPRRVAQLSPAASALRSMVTRWALANARSVGFDALTVILATKEEHPAQVDLWAEDDIWRLWWVDLSDWCALRGLRTPDGLASTMLSLLAFLDATGGFAAGSDTHAELEAAMQSTGALWRGRSVAPAG